MATPCLSITHEIPHIGLDFCDFYGTVPHSHHVHKYYFCGNSVGFLVGEQFRKDVNSSDQINPQIHPVSKCLLNTEDCIHVQQSTHK